MRKLNVALIGCGSRMQQHMAAIEQMEDITVAAVAEPIAQRREQAAARFGCSRCYETFSDLLDQENAGTLDCLIIAVNPTAHGDCELRAVEMGIPFLVEKPMTVDIEMAEKVEERIRQTGLITSVGFQDRYLNLMEIMREELPKHPSGGLVYGSWVGSVPGVWWWQKKAATGGQLVEQSIHLLDALRWLYGEPLSVYATSSRGIITPGVDAPAEYDTDDHSTAVFRFPNHVTATLVSGCYVYREGGVKPNNGLVISLRDMVMDYRRRTKLILQTPEGRKEIPAVKNQAYRLNRAFFDAVLTGDPSGIRSPYSDALKTLRLGFAANLSMDTGEVVSLQEE